MTHSPLKKTFEFAFNALAAAIIVIDGIARPLYRPVIEWANGLEFLQKIEAQVADLPRPAILALFTVPFAIAEPAKVVALIWLAEGSLFSGIALLAISYLATFLLIERIYHAGRHKLLTYGWFSWSMRQLSVIREKISEARSRVKRFVASLLR